MRIMRLGVAAGLVLALLATPSAAGDVVRVNINDLAFQPAEVRAKVGDTIEWVNGDFVDHTATDKAGAWDIAIGAGKSAHLQLTAPGTFTYFCKVHPGMTGTINVVTVR